MGREDVIREPCSVKEGPTRGVTESVRKQLRGKELPRFVRVEGRVCNGEGNAHPRGICKTIKTKEFGK